MKQCQSCGMPLQTDPTVIYGLGESFDGNLRRADLRTDHPWNTYTRKVVFPLLPKRSISQSRLHSRSNERHCRQRVEGTKIRFCHAKDGTHADSDVGTLEKVI